MKLIILFTLFAFAHCASIIVNTTATIKFADRQFIAKTDTGLMNVSIIVNNMRCEKCALTRECIISKTFLEPPESAVIVIDSVFGDMIIVDYEINSRVLYTIICGISLMLAMLYVIVTLAFACALCVPN